MATITMTRPARSGESMSRQARRAMIAVWLRLLRVPDANTLRAWDDAQLVALLNKRGHHVEVYERITNEWDRRAVAERQAADRKRRAQERRLAERTAHYEAIHALFLDAERECRGHLVNKAGREARVAPESLLYGTWSRAKRYASEEFLEWGLECKRITLAEWRRQTRERQTS